MSFKSEKVCPKCKLDKSLSEFYPAPASRKKDKLQSWCKECSKIACNNSAKKRYRKFMEEINKIKLAQGCKDCGYNKAPEALDFDHVGEKRFGISYGVRHSWEDVLNEIDSCEVVCANCHRIRTKQRNVIPFGTSKDC